MCKDERNLELAVECVEIYQQREQDISHELPKWLDTECVTVLLSCV